MRCHALPFQRAVNVWMTLPLDVKPTAHALVRELAPMAEKTLSEFGLGLATRLQVRPFQCRITVLSPTGGFCTYPDAQALLDDVAVTAVKTALPPGVGLAIRFQARPFQCWMSVLSADPAEKFPTAHTSFAEMDQIPLRNPPRLPAGLGLGACRHLVPFQCTMSGREIDPSLKSPTAQMFLAETARTPSSSPDAPIFGLGTAVRAEQFDWSTNMANGPPLCWEPTAQALQGDSTVALCSTLLVVPESGGCAPGQLTQVPADTGLAATAGSKPTPATTTTA